MLIFQRVLNNLFILVLCAVLSAAYFYQFIKREEPCPLCLLQRLGMIGSAVALLLNLRFGIKIEHYGLAILSALLGRIVSLCQISLHVCPKFPTFGEPLWGFDLYVWAFIVFTCTVFACAILLIIKGYSKVHEYPPTWGAVEKILFAFVFILALGNAVTTYLDCGFTAC